MNAIWSDEQRRCLDALGYTLYRPATTAVDAAEGAASARPDTPDARAGRSPDGSAARISSGAIDPLLRALLQAARCDPERIGDTAAWLRSQQIASLTQLRNNPASKRALWPRLRALRRDTSAR